jgi:dolichol-phosphate mannosyltransferase
MISAKEGKKETAGRDVSDVVQERLVIVIPIHNEADNLDALVERITKATADLHGWSTELLFVDDGSTDNSLAKLHDMRTRGIPVGYISLFRNFGHQAALAAGIEAADGDAVITMDGDLQHPPEDIPRMIAAFETGAEIVQMVRNQPANNSKGMLSRLFYKVFSLTSQSDIVIDASDFRLLGRKVVVVLRQIPERSKFLRGLIPSLGFPLVTLPYAEAPRTHGVPSYSFAKSLRLANQALFDFSTVPLRFVFWFGTTLAFVSFCFGVGHVAVKFVERERIVPGFTDIIASILFLSGCILALLGIVSRYLILILDQLRGRPLFLIKERVPGQPLRPDLLDR